VLQMLLGVAGTAFGSAVLPLVSIELIIIGAAAGVSGHLWLAVAAAAAVGQVAGKSLYLLAARSRLPLPSVLRRRIDAAVITTARSAGRFRRLREHCEHSRPQLLSVLAVSSLTGLPPIMLTTVLAGLSGVRVGTYVAVCLPLRFARFAVVAAAPDLLLAWLG